jgi:tryptophan synthase alpha chain
VNHRIDRCFDEAAARGRKALIPFMTAGDPHPEWTVALMHALADSGADLIELGVPFSDPMADGPVIQAASERALGRGVDLQRVFGWVEEFREENAAVPIVLMGYLNPFERFGYERLAKAAGGAGVDGLLLVDCPPEEMRDLGTSLADRGIYSIRLVAPTTTLQRMRTIAESASGFLYYVSFKGITGASRLDTDALAEPLRQLRSVSDLPLAVGFGIGDADSALAVAAHADAVVIGSALVKRLGDCRCLADAETAAREFVAPLRESLDNVYGAPPRQAP